jgi:hypothetical protein
VDRGEAEAAGTKPEKDRTALIALAGIVVLLALALVGAKYIGVKYVREGNESNAIAACKEIGSAQSLYHRTDWDGNGYLQYAIPFTLLCTQKAADGNEVRYIPEKLAQATRPGRAFRGYYFVDIVNEGMTMPYVAGPCSPNEFGICAAPARYPASGRRTFIMDTTGTVYGKDNGGRPVTIFPPSPRAAGWVVVE